MKPLVVLWAILLCTAAVPPVHAQQSVLRGRFHIIWSDVPPAAVRVDEGIAYVLVDDQGRSHRLVVSDEVLAAAGGALALDRRRVAVAPDPGARFGAQALSAGDAAVQVGSIRLDEPLRATAPGAMVEEAAVAGSQAFANILCRFADSPDVTPHPPSWFETLMGPVAPGLDHYWREQSYGAVNLTGTAVFGWYTLPAPRSAYFFSTTRFNTSKALEDCTAAADADVHFPAFAGINLMFNQDLDCCAWGGSWTLYLDGQPKDYALTWLPPWGFDNQGIMGHEMGHGFGLPHSSGPYGETYDSRWDVMSSVWGNCSFPDPVYGCVGVHTIATYKERLGWIPPGRHYIGAPGTIQTITLERLALPGAAGTHLMATLPIPGSGDFYTAEARRFAGYDIRLPAEAVVLHRVVDGNAYVVDPDGDGDPNDDGAQWLPGETFFDETGIAVSVDAETQAGFVVTIEMPGASLQEVPPVADTYIEAGTEASWDHGASAYMDTDASPAGIAYLKFDLSSLQSSVALATLRLHCINSSVDGGTIYPVDDSSWPEGTGTGVDSSSAGGPGLKWTQVDTNRDGRVDARDTSGYVPDFTRPIAAIGRVTAGSDVVLDVTEAFQSGAALYTLAIASTNTDGATYSSRQNPSALYQPRLEIESDSRPANSECSRATVIPSLPFTDTRSTRGAGESDDDPQPSCTTSGPIDSVWYRYTPARDGVLTVTTAGSDYNTVAGVYTGACLSLVEAACSDDAGGGLHSEVRLPVTAGTIYTLMVIRHFEAETGGTLQLAVDLVVAGRCGDGRVDPGEDCDLGADVPGDCCSATCAFVAAGTTCRAAGGACDLAETCTGGSAVCPADRKSTAVCRPAAGPCDVAERCDGAADACPADGGAPAGSVCPDDGNPCTADVCNASRMCTHPVAPPVCGDGVVCGTETCDPPGTGGGCPVGQGCGGNCACTATACGNGVVEPGEQCDDGNRLDGDACDPTCRVSGPVADTYIEAGAEATWDHGAARHLDVDASPAGITYLKFDLSRVAGPVTRATLTLHCTNSSIEGGTFHPVGDSSWVEGTRTGIDGSSVGGPGLKWTEVDTNRDGRVDARDGSRFVPDFTRPIATLGRVTAGLAVTVDVTAAFQAGQGTYTLALRSGSSDGATYSSRQHPTVSQRPRLRLTVGATGD